MHEGGLHRARIISSVSATIISLACGTNYVYSAWAPQFADKLLLTATQSNLIGLAGNLGMYSLGVPVGMFVDAKGPRPAVIVGSVLLGVGYFPIQQAYVAGSGSVAALCFFSFLTGLGGCMAFASAVKTSALNWPHHRGTATALPLAAFGLSAFFFSLVGSLLMPGDTSAFLLTLAVGTFALTFVGFFFLRVLPHAAIYHSLPGATQDGDGDLNTSQQLQRTNSAEDKVTARNKRRSGVPTAEEPGRSTTIDADSHHGYDRTAAATTADPDIGEGAAATATVMASSSQETLSRPQTPSSPSASNKWNYSTMSPASAPSSAAATAVAASPTAPNFVEDADLDPVDETSSLMSRASSLPGDVLVQNSVDLDRSHRIDIRGWTLLRSIEFWQLFTIMGILAGIGLMTINNIGHNANALWKHYDDSVSDGFLIRRQQMHVSILSIGSFVGRLLSGVGSDFLVKKLHASRVWCLVLASAIFCIAQVCALRIENPHFLGLVSSLSGLGYGFLFGVFPSIVAESFGIHGLSQNWGFMTLSPVVSGNIFNLFYGSVFDQHTIIGHEGERTCPDGRECYRAAYIATLGACSLGLIVTLLVIRHQHLQREKEAGKRSLED